VPEFETGNAGESLIGLVAGKGAARALEGLDHDADGHAAPYGRAEGVVQLLMRTG
jgi:hypothetical protein